MYVQHSDVPEPPYGLFGWITAPWRVSDRELEDKRGLDVVMYQLVLQACFWVCTGWAVFGYAILVPVHITAGGVRSGQLRCRLRLNSEPRLKVSRPLA